MARNPSKLDGREAEARTLLAEGLTNVEVARRLGVSESAVRRFRAREGLEPADLDPETSVTSNVPAEWGDIRALLRRRGLSVDEWLIVGARVNEWGDQQQLRVDLKPRLGLLAPARTDGWRPPPRVTKAKGPSRLVALFGDHHCPHHDHDLHAAVCQWLRDHQPDEWVVLGDLLDLDAVSRHRHNPQWSATTQECVDAGYAVLRGYVAASPNSRRRMIRGNHEDRLRNATLDHMTAVHGLTRGALDGENPGAPVLSIRHLLRLDELEVDLGCEGDEYAHDQVQITPELAARHGWIARKGSGTSALATIDHLRYSVVIGHTHRQSIVHHTAHSIDGTPKTLLGAEAGTLARVQGGLGYAVAPDWQPGFATAQVWDDGQFKLDLATWVNGRLLWRDWRSGPVRALEAVA